ncbi:MAG: 3'-to-5' exoribonuclease RNase R [Firmicutes bacterium]|nr:3'-to-5' exoribonuclease RNase R [Bacillota bacterium]
MYDLQLKELILQYMKENAYKPLTAEELAARLDIGGDNLPRFLETLKEMESEGDLVQTRKKRYGIPEKMDLIVGRLQCHQKGFGFVIPRDELYEDVYIPADSINEAMHNDSVIAKIVRRKSEGNRTEGEIIRILERANKKVVGTFERSRNFGFVIPDDSRILYDIYVFQDETMGAREGDKVVAEITHWPEKRRNPEGRIIEVLGYKDDIGIDVLSIIRSHDIPEEFPPEVLEEAEKIPEKIDEAEINRRVDLRDRKIVTIDGADAKDLDDAVSVEKLSNGNFRLGVHIADVSHYVKENSALDKEAFKRGTSVYFLDRVIPMLPKRLSNGICSLNPKVDRLALTVFMEIDKAGKVVDYQIVESVISTAERMTYKDVSDILEKNDEELIARYGSLVDDFRRMEELYTILNSKRMVRGSIDFEFPETKVMLDKEGNPEDIVKVERRTADRIIEEFMLVCNETVAEHMFWLGAPFVYRIHEEPDDEKIEVFNEFVYNLGYSIKGIKKVHPKALQRLIQKVKGKKEEKIINTLLLRSLKRARYHQENLGHYGLAAEYYCHFTSPIRRYPDLVIHRIIKETLKGGLENSRIEYLKEFVEKAALQSSERERAADEAEREVEDLKKVEFMARRIGEEYEGIVSGVTAFGIFVELENGIEGMVRVSFMTDDFYHFDEKRYMLIGERTKKSFRIGDVVRVQVVKADLVDKKLDFVLV